MCRAKAQLPILNGVLTEMELKPQYGFGEVKKKPLRPQLRKGYIKLNQ